MNPNSKVGEQIRAFSTTETLSTTEGTDFSWANGQSTFPCLINIVSELSGSQCFSGFKVGIHESTSHFGMNRNAEPRRTQKVPQRAMMFHGVNYSALFSAISAPPRFDEMI
jgi:hypothetical protein